MIAGVLVGVVVLSLAAAVWLGVALYQVRQELAETDEALKEARTEISEMKQKLAEISEALKEAVTGISDVAGEVKGIAESLEEIAGRLGGGTG